MRERERRRLAGQLRWRDGNQIDITLGLDKVAIGGLSSHGVPRLAMVSCVGYAGDLKAFRAGLAVGLNAAMELVDPDGHRLAVKQGNQSIVPQHVFALSGVKYTGESHRLGYNVFHGIFIAQTKGLMLDGSDEALWNELKAPRFTTPLLRSWLPYLRRELASAGKLVPLGCLDCDCMGLTATTQDLDGIVEHGLKNGLITIDEEDAA